MEELLEPTRNSDEVMAFSTSCPDCNAPCFTNMKLIDIPHFKCVVLMATNCDKCGHRTTEIKSGCGIESKGVRLSHAIKNNEDLKLEVVKSDTCTIKIPNLELEIVSSSAGKYTTIEGVCQDIIDGLQHLRPHIEIEEAMKQSVDDKMATIYHRLNNPIGLTLMIDDPTGNSFIEKADIVEHYERNNDQDEELGLNDMKVENYSSDT